MMILYKESKKLSQIVHKSSEILLFWEFWTVLDSFGQLRGFGRDGLNLSKRGGFYHFVQNLPTLVPTSILTVVVCHIFCIAVHAGLHCDEMMPHYLNFIQNMWPEPQYVDMHWQFFYNDIWHTYHHLNPLHRGGRLEWLTSSCPVWTSRPTSQWRSLCLHCWILVYTWWQVLLQHLGRGISSPHDSQGSTKQKWYELWIMFEQKVNTVCGGEGMGNLIKRATNFPSDPIRSLSTCRQN